MTLVKTVFIFVALIIAMILVTPFALVLFLGGFLGLRRQCAPLIYRIAQGWARIPIALSGCRLRVEGVEHIPRTEGLCFVSNHQGVFDILLALAYAGRPFGFIAKKELLFIPLVNLWIYLLGGLFIDRRDPRKALGTIAEGVRKIKAGSAMLIFPEGHRSRGEGLLPFHPGSFKLATQAGVPIVPVAIDGSYEFFDRDKRVHQVDVRLTFLPPIPTVGLAPEARKHLLAEQVRTVIAETLERRA